MNEEEIVSEVRGRLANIPDELIDYIQQSVVPAIKSEDWFALAHALGVIRDKAGSWSDGAALLQFYEFGKKL